MISMLHGFCCAPKGLPVYMRKRLLRIIKWIGQVPAEGICTGCNRNFTVPLTSLGRLADAQKTLKLKFDGHKCPLQEGDAK